MPSLKGFEWTFDTEASRYEKMRPGYVDALYKEIFAYIPIDENSQVLEIGSGGGQATEPLLKTGCRLTAVEYGKNFSNLLLNKFGHYPGFDVVTSKFEEAVLEKDAYDFIYSASAFHWIPEAIGNKKVYELLKNGGVFARFANWTGMHMLTETTCLFHTSPKPRSWFRNTGKDHRISAGKRLCVRAARMNNQQNARFWIIPEDTQCGM